MEAAWDQRFLALEGGLNEAGNLEVSKTQRNLGLGARATRAAGGGGGKSGLRWRGRGTETSSGLPAYGVPPTAQVPLGNQLGQQDGSTQLC